MLGFLPRRPALDAAAAYSTFNMGSGFALYCAAGAGEEIVGSQQGLGLSALLAGRVEEGPGR